MRVKKHQTVKEKLEMPHEPPKQTKKEFVLTIIWIITLLGMAITTVCMLIAGLM